MRSGELARSVLRLCRPSTSLNGLAIARSRAFATTAPGAGTLPLAGIRVLDMTRVLAGVCVPFDIEYIVLSGLYQKLTNVQQPYCTQILGDLGYGD